jgi:hypothetical protein
MNRARLRPLVASCTLLGCLLPPLAASVVDFGRDAPADVPAADATDSSLGRWHGSERLLRTRGDAEGTHLVTPSQFPGSWISTVFAPAPALLGGDNQARGLVRFSLDVRFDEEPRRRARGNVLSLFVGTGGDEPGHALRLNIKDDGSICFFGGGAETPVGDKLQAGAWTRLVAEIDFDARTVSLRVGQAPAVAGFPLTSDRPRTRFGRIEFKTDGSDTAWLPLSFDNLRLERLR